MLSGTADLGDWAAVAGAAFTAAAAFAAWLTARQGRQLIEDAERPRLDVQVLVGFDEMRRLRLAVVNTGRGTARGARYLVHALGQVVEGAPDDGFVRGGERIHVRTDIPVPHAMVGDAIPDLGVMVSCRDAEGFVHYWTHRGREYVPRTLMRRRPRYPDRTEAFKRFFAEIDVTGPAVNVVGSAAQRPLS